MRAIAAVHVPRNSRHHLGSGKAQSLFSGSGRRGASSS